MDISASLGHLIIGDQEITGDAAARIREQLKNIVGKATGDGTFSAPEVTEVIAVALQATGVKKPAAKAGKAAGTGSTF